MKMFEPSRGFEIKQLPQDLANTALMNEITCFVTGKGEIFFSLHVNHYCSRRQFLTFFWTLGQKWLDISNIKLHLLLFF